MLYDCDEKFEDTFENEIANMLRRGDDRKPKTQYSFEFLLNRPFALSSSVESDNAVLSMPVFFDGKTLQGSVIYEEPSLKLMVLNFFNSELNVRCEEKDFLP